MPLLQVRDLIISTPRTTLVGPVSFGLDAGERRALLGPSGSGKSLTTAAILGTLSPALATSGSITLGGHEVLPLALPLRGSEVPTVAFIHQDPSRALNPQTTVGAHLATALGAASPTAPEVHELLVSLAFEDPERIALALPHELSGGQRQRVCIGIALAKKPALLIADEPTTALDAVTQAEILSLLDRSLPSDCALLFITHDLAAAHALSATAYHMEAGTIHHEDECPPTPEPLPFPQALRTREVRDGERPEFDLQHVSVSYRARPRLFAKTARFPALADVSLTIARGERLGIVGSSGSGKSTLMAAMLGLLAPSDGCVHFRGRDVRALSGDALRQFRRAVQCVPQDARGSLNPRAGVLDQVIEPLHFLSPPHGEAASAADHEARAEKALEELGIEKALWRSRPHEISGGQAQRVALARALVTRPSLIIADEPFSGLDRELRESAECALASILEEREEMGLLLISHDLGSVMSLCDRVIVMDAGRVVEDTPTSGLMTRTPQEALARLIEAHCMDTGSPLPWAAAS